MVSSSYVGGYKNIQSIQFANPSSKIKDVYIVMWKISNDLHSIFKLENLIYRKSLLFFNVSEKLQLTLSYYSIIFLLSCNNLRRF